MSYYRHDAYPSWHPLRTLVHETSCLERPEYIYCMTLLLSPELESCEPSSTDPTKDVYGTRTKVVYHLRSKEAALTVPHRA